MSLDKTRLEQLRRAALTDPDCEELIELVLGLTDEPGTRPEARELCLRSLAENPHNHIVRLLLARLYYLDKLGEFCVRELFELKRRIKGAMPTLDRLLEAFGDYAHQFAPVALDSREQRASSNAEGPRPLPSKSSKVIAELDLDADFTDLLEDLDDDGNSL